MAMASFVNWISNCVVSFAFLPLLKSKYGPVISFEIFAVSSIIGWFFVKKYVVETKGRTLDEVVNIIKEHQDV